MLPVRFGPYSPIPQAQGSITASEQRRCQMVFGCESDSVRRFANVSLLGND